MMIEAGWRSIDPPVSDKKKKKEPPTLPAVEKGEVVDQKAEQLKEGETKPPKRYTEATLLGAMERAGEGLEEKELKRAMKRKGLGTPATRASIIETLLNRQYIVRDKKNLLPTEQGSALLRALPVEVLRSPRLTGEWEARLASIAEGEETRDTFMRDIRGFVTTLVDEIREAEVDPAVQVGQDKGVQSTGEVVGACPKCKSEVRQGPRGWACTGCSFMIFGTIAKRAISVRMVKSLLEKGQTTPVKGFRSKAGKEFRAALRLDDDGNVVFFFPEAESLGDCPGCGKPVRLRGKFYTCDSGRDCPFIVSKTLKARDVPEEVIRQLVEAGESDALDGFHKGDEDNPSDETFEAKLIWNGKRVNVVPFDRRTGSGPVGSCPSCSAEVSFDGRRWKCSGCQFQIPGAVAQRELRFEEVAQLLKDGRTSRLYGFRQRSGSTFKAALVLDPKRGVQLDFSRSEDEERAIPPGGLPPAFGTRIDCPRCIKAAEIDPGYVIAGREAWGCSRWKQGCGFRVPFEIHGVAIPAEEAQRLFSKARATKYLEKPIGPPGRRKTSRVVLEPEQDPCWRLEPKTKKGRKI
jgi:hypothetical protein